MQKTENKYSNINSKSVDSWVKSGWEWGKPIYHGDFLKAKEGKFKLFLTPFKKVPDDWLGNIKGKKVLGLAAGGGQQMPILKALGADITLIDNSKEQVKTDEEFAKREGYKGIFIKGDMTEKLPFEDSSFDLIVNPVSLVYVDDFMFVFKECGRVLKKGGIILTGLDNGFNFAFDDETGKIMFTLPFNPLKDKEQYDYMVKNDYGIQFSHSLSEQLNGLIKNGFKILDTYEDTNLFGKLKDFNVPTFMAVKAMKE